MTPDERAAQAVPRDIAALSRDELISHVTAAIRDAVTAERQACARLAAVIGMPRENGTPRQTTSPEQKATARLAVRIAQAIEARGSD